ncbi:MAG: 1-deoxy-D-xylulose-5-phosphate synthase, partial [Alphaproteobacteria bacterium]|nr:1-deoxy-D-xylulose-5-phosphate synthase [Alphaproteobacteria bacterium]
ILSYGARLQECLAAADILAARGVSCTVADARFAKPLDTALVADLVKNHKGVVTIEEGSAQGFGAIVLQHLAGTGAFDRGCRIRTLHLPDIYQDQDKPEKQYEQAGLSAAHIATAAARLAKN